MKYIQVYSFEAMDMVGIGEKVYLLDRQKCTVTCVNDMTVRELAEVCRENKADGRFEFWYVREGEVA
jgi:hypothetical protein